MTLSPRGWTRYVYKFYMLLYVPDFPCQVGLSYSSRRRFCEGAQDQAQ